MRDLKEVLAENRDKYIEQLKNLVSTIWATALPEAWRRRGRITCSACLRRWELRRRRIP